MNNSCCTICGNKQKNRIYKVKERMQNQGEEFPYLLCSNCGTLQRIDEVSDMGRYYENYPVFELRNENISYSLGQRVYMRTLLSKVGRVFREVSLYKNKVDFINCLVGLGMKKTQKILDVGCGNGIWLQQLESIGFCNLTGVDKYVPDRKRKSKCTFYKGEIYDIAEKSFDLIALHHSFEHMTEPEAVLHKVKALLADTGICIIRIPVMGGIAWKRYKTDWYQIDAPRHAYLYTERAMELLCSKAGLEIFDIKYDSQYGQFYVSEQYSKGNKSFSKICGMNIDEKAVKKYKKWSRLANWRKEGDQAIFYIRKK